MPGRKEQKEIIKRRNGFCFCDKYPEFCDSWAKDNGYTVDQVRDAIAFYFEAINGAYEHPMMPKIYMKHLGWYKPKVELLKAKLRRDFNKYHSSKITEKGLRKTIKESWPVIKRLQKEKTGVGKIPQSRAKKMRDEIFKDIFGDDIEQSVNK